MGILTTWFDRQQTRKVLIRRDRHEVDVRMKGLCREFSDEDWALLLYLPVDAYWLAAATGDGLDRSATAMFGRLLDGAYTLPNQLLATLVGDVASSGPAELLRIVSVESPGARASRMARTKSILRQKLSPAQYQRFLGLLLVLAHQMAKAAGMVSDRQQRALLSFASQYEVDLPSALACTCSAR